MSACRRSWRRRIGSIAAGVVIAAGGALTAATTASAEPSPPQGDIVGGSEVKNAPSWSAAVGSSGTNMWCSGSLVASQWVLTAKHCSGANVVRVGSKNTESGGTLRDVTQTVAHSKYDVRLYKLESSVDNAPIAIANTSPSNGSKATLYGHGQTCPEKYCGGMSPALRSTTSTVVADSQCGGIVGAGELCLDTSVTSTDCYGDSGGAAVVNGRLVGADSRAATGPDASTCGKTNSIYSDVTAVKSWVESTTSG